MDIVLSQLDPFYTLTLHFYKTLFNIALPLIPTSPKLHLRSRFSYQHFFIIFHLPMCVTCSANLGILYLITSVLGWPIQVAARSEELVPAARLLGKRIESRQGHGCLSLVSVVCCQVEVYATDRSLVQRSPTECGVPECDHEASTMRRTWPPRGCRTIIYIYIFGEESKC